MKIISTGRSNGVGARQLVRLSLGALGIAAAFLAAPAAFADEADPAPAGAAIVETAPQPAGDAVIPAPAVPAPVSHLSSPDNLPPGTTDAAPQQQTRLSYLRDVWQAIRTEDVTMGDALLFIAQRPLDAKAAPPAGVAMGPSGPVGTSAPAAVVIPSAGAATSPAGE